MTIKNHRVYYYNALRRECMERGLVWSEAMIDIAEPAFIESGLNQNQVMSVVRAHMDIMQFAFHPKNYSWPVRIALALNFLGLIRLPCHGK